MSRLPDPKLWTPLDLMPHVVWRDIFKKLDRESMLSVRKLTPQLDCCVPPIYNPTLHLDEVFPLLALYISPKELPFFKQVNSFWRQCTDNQLDSQCSDWRAEIDMRTPSFFLQFSTVAHFHEFDEAFGLANVAPSVHRRVVLKIPTSQPDIVEFVGAARQHLDRYGMHIWHLRIDTEVLYVVFEGVMASANMIASFAMECLVLACNLKTLYWSTNFLNGLPEYYLRINFDFEVMSPRMAQLEKFTLDPFRESLWHNLMKCISSLKVFTFERHSHYQWHAITSNDIKFLRLQHLEVEVTPETIHILPRIAESKNWRLSSLHIISRVGTLQSVDFLKKVIRLSQDSLEELSVLLLPPDYSDSGTPKGAFNRLQHELKLQNLKRLQLENFVEDSFDCLPSFGPKLKSVTLVNCLLLNEATEIFTGNWETECWKNVTISSKGWGDLKSLTKVTITGYMKNDVVTDGPVFSRVTQRPQNM